MKSSAKRELFISSQMISQHSRRAIRAKGRLAAKSAETNGDSVSFLFNGDIKELLNAVNSLPIYDMTITEPTLDEIFMHYYEKGGENQ